MSSSTGLKSAATSSRSLLRCQRIQQRIHAKLASAILGVESGVMMIFLWIVRLSLVRRRRREVERQETFLSVIMRSLQVLLFLLL
jgi:hypothetical protein